MDPQERVAQILRTYSIRNDVRSRLMDVMSELGEVSKDMLKATDYGAVTPDSYASLGQELGDVYFALLALVQACDVDLEQALKQVCIKYEQRMEHKGEMSSGA